jgi:hypothetical protein
MSCSKCSVEPGTHCFLPIGTLGDATVFYTSPARARSVGLETEESLQDIRKHLDTALGRKWVLVLDCYKMKTQHQTSQEYTDKILSILSNDHKDILEGMIVIHPNIWIRLFCKVLQPFYTDELLNKLKMIDGKGDVLLQKMQRIGFSEECISNLGKIFATPIPGVADATVASSPSLKK